MKIKEFLKKEPSHTIDVSVSKRKRKKGRMLGRLQDKVNQSCDLHLRYCDTCNESSIKHQPRKENLNKETQKRKKKFLPLLSLSP